MKKNIKLLIEYDGTNYAGWQKQKNAVTIQQVLEEAIKKITKENIEVIGCSRTDAGVHARGFIANFFTESSIPGDKFKYAINSKLPDDIVILLSEEVESDFHSRYSSEGKKYIYTVLNREEKVVIGRNYLYNFSPKLDLKLMIEGSKYFLGTHEFDSFRKKGSSVKTTRRTIYSLEIIKIEDTIKFIISGDGFLYNMVRIMVGTLLDVGTGKIKPDHVKDIILAKSRAETKRSVPAKGLCLEEVFFSKEKLK
ncbi:tRNA pseudouridine(38-40) synthase TruA [Clostridium sp. MB40-C1]|uniref:tRNA pseudouridine(38-40) synthase TruA n=1 Tax=Clostridium sp. MB40-C1 TaxID=3070996 RepID=UPI0027DF9913|nr:tRNA pseudouridine(38-40) synthase TruA [Clostridium sp. MB40-C1]WMJ80373.1 tRNA pseudouridine(38-40) synthase TruA [Clostridium sp. MB40-C1]